MPTIQQLVRKGREPKRRKAATPALKVRDLWAHASLGAATGKFTSSSIPKHGSMFLKLTTQ